MKCHRMVSSAWQTRGGSGDRGPVKSAAVLAVGCCSSSLYDLLHSINCSMTHAVLVKLQKINLCHWFILVVILTGEAG